MKLKSSEVMSEPGVTDKRLGGKTPSGLRGKDRFLKMSLNFCTENPFFYSSVPVKVPLLVPVFTPLCFLAVIERCDSLLYV